MKYSPAFSHPSLDVSGIGLLFLTGRHLGKPNHQPHGQQPPSGKVRERRLVKFLLRGSRATQQGASPEIRGRGRTGTSPGLWGPRLARICLGIHAHFIKNYLVNINSFRLVGATCPVTGFCRWLGIIYLAFKSFLFFS